MNDIAKPSDEEAAVDDLEPQPTELSGTGGLLGPLDDNFDPNAGLGERDLLNPTNLADLQESTVPDVGPELGLLGAEQPAPEAKPEATGDLLGGATRVDPPKPLDEDDR
mgnify:CR=1 FL=1|jgi:hypothetical protein